MPLPHVAAVLEKAGLSAEAADGKSVRFAHLVTLLERESPAPRTWSAWFVPGRIEVLGKHTDYAGGRSLLCAAERGFCVVAAPRSDGLVTIADYGRRVTVTLDPREPASSPGWTRYPLTVHSRVRRNFPEATQGVSVLLDSDLPPAAGMSSSSALMIVVLFALAHANNLEASTEWTENIRTTEDLAAYAATIENGRGFRGLASESGVGTEGGSEDHTAILCCRPGEIAQYAFCPTRHERSMTLPPELVFAIGVSGIAARKTGNARDDYNRASQNASLILERWRRASGRVDASLSEAVASAPDAADRIRALLGSGGDDSVLIDRFEQFVEESTVLIPEGGTQLIRGDVDGFGRTVARSQDLAERLLRNQVPETATLARAARNHGALAASSFGAGFGGSVWALVERSGARRFLDRWQNAYATACPGAAPRAAFFLTPPGPPAIRLTLHQE